MSRSRKIGTTTYPIMFLMVDEVDHITGLAGLTPTVTISKNGGAFAPADGAVSSIGNGWYALAGDVDDRNTLGTLCLHATAAGADPTDVDFDIVSEDPFAAEHDNLPGGAIVDDAGNTAVAFKTNLAETANDYWKDTYLKITSGVLIHQVRRVIGYNGTTKVVTVVGGFTGIPADTVTFRLINE